jgi:hypothetical protein
MLLTDAFFNMAFIFFCCHLYLLAVISSVRVLFIFLPASIGTVEAGDKKVGIKPF